MGFNLGFKRLNCWLDSIQCQ